MSRRDQALDAAITVLGGEGARRLTHRAVDAAAGLPTGSTSNYFRSREALLHGIVARLAELDRIDWERLTRDGHPVDLGQALTGFARHATGPGRPRTTARYALFLDAANNPDLRAALTAAREGIVAWGQASLAVLGSADPDRHARIMLNYLDGVMFQQVCLPDPAFDPAPGIGTVLAGLLLDGGQSS